MKLFLIVPVALLLLAATALAQEPEELDITRRMQLRQAYAMSASLEDGRTRCGADRVEDWELDLEQFWRRPVTDPDSTIAEVIETEGDFFDEDDGVFTAPVNGFYKVSVYVRAESGNVDLTLMHEGDVVAGFGSNAPEVTGGWGTYGVTKILRLEEDDEVYVRLESGGATDCIGETDFKYGQFNVILLLADELLDETA